MGIDERTDKYYGMRHYYYELLMNQMMRKASDTGLQSRCSIGQANM